MVWVKICGVRTVEDAVACADAGVDAVGMNFWPGSPRHCSMDGARRIRDAVGSRVTLVGVFVDASTLEIESVRRAVGIDWVQLHGDEPPTVLAGLLPHAYKAMRLRAASDLDRANSYGGERLLVDAFVSGQPGGTGCLPDWVHAAELARRRPVVLAGGLTPANVGDAIRAVQPFGVDVASGVEIAPGRKDPEKVAAFVRAARGA